MRCKFCNRKLTWLEQRKDRTCNDCRITDASMKELERELHEEQANG